MVLFDILLVLHIGAGVTALIAAAVATITKYVDASHRIHVVAGTVFFIAMCLVCATAVPMSVIHPSTFLLLIALFSLYLVLTGWRYGRNRGGVATPFDWGIQAAMGIVSIGMVGYGIVLLAGGDMGGITMAVFGAIGAVLSGTGIRRLRSGALKGRRRIAAHLTNMLAATIAAVTAFVVTNVQADLSILPWLAPTVVITPIIVIWNRKILAGKRVKGMRSSEVVE